MSDLITKEYAEKNPEYFEVIDHCWYCRSCNAGEGLKHQEGCAYPKLSLCDRQLEKAKEVLKALSRCAKFAKLENIEQYASDSLQAINEMEGK